MPNIPTTNDVTTLSPMWKENAFPIKLMIKIKIPPKIEFNINFKIAFSGIENTFPITQKIIIHPKIITIFETSKFYHHTSLLFLITFLEK